MSEASLHMKPLHFTVVRDVVQTHRKLESLLNFVLSARKLRISALSWCESFFKELLKHFDVRYSIVSFTDVVRLENEPEKIDFSYANQLY